MGAYALITFKTISPTTSLTMIILSPCLLKNGVVGVRRQGDRIILVKLVVGDMVLNVISAYAPQVGLDESAKTVLGRLRWPD